MTEPVHTVTLQFEDCEAGWIRFAVIVGEQRVEISASEVFDPFPDLLRWMHAILTDVEECSFTIDEEGVEKQFVARRRCPNNLQFLIRDPAVESEEQMRAIVGRRQLIEAFYKSVQQFARSTAYRKDEWEPETLGDRLQRILPTWNEGQIIEHLIAMDRHELAKALFDAAPSYMLRFPGAADEAEEWRRAIDYMVAPDNPETSAGLYREPVEWKIPDDYDDWVASSRSSLVLHLLGQRVSGYAGCKLQEWESASIERYLEHPEIDNGTW